MGLYFNGYCGVNLIEMVRIFVISGRFNEVCDVKLFELSVLYGFLLFLVFVMRCIEIFLMLRFMMFEVVKMLEFICKI